jgi:hypothetical protein
MSRDEVTQLLDVVGEPAGHCFVETAYRGRTYCVPERAAYTKKTFSLLAQLIALKTKTSDLAILPTVRVAP